MIESNSLDNGKFLLAGDSKIPDWVLERINAFKTDLYNISKSSKSDDKATLDQIIRSFDHYILPTGIKVTKRIDKKELGSIIDRMAELLDEAIGNDLIPYRLNSQVFKILSFLVNHPHPTKEDEEK